MPCDLDVYVFIQLSLMRNFEKVSISTGKTGREYQQNDNITKSCMHSDPYPFML